VPSGDQPDGTATAIRAHAKQLAERVFSAVPVGRLPTGAGTLSALPVFQTPSTMKSRRKSTRVGCSQIRGVNARESVRGILSQPVRLGRVVLALMLCAAGAGVFAQGRAPFDAKPKARRPEPDGPRLPRVLVIGDSISAGYTPDLRKRLAGKANVHRMAEVGGPTTNGLAKLEQCLGTNHWDIIHFNFGLHDMKIIAGGTRMVPIEEYERNLECIVTRLKKTGATLIWASTTPIPEGRLSPPRQPGDEVHYNEAARRVMKGHNLLINDLHAFIRPRLSDWQYPANVHFTPEGCDALAEEIARVVTPFLREPRADSR
jgi:acyl-CoA thioesterase-1